MTDCGFDICIHNKDGKCILENEETDGGNFRGGCELSNIPKEAVEKCKKAALEKLKN